MWKTILGIIVVLLIAVAVFTGGHVELGSPQIQSVDVKLPDNLAGIPIPADALAKIIGTNTLAKAELITHTYIWGSEGLFSKEYDIEIYVAGTLIAERPCITKKGLNDALMSLENTYSGIINLINQPVSKGPTG